MPYRQLLRQAGVLQPSVHDRDMFIVMAKPVLRTVFMVWDPTEDGKLIFRMLEGILDYASACVHFDMRDLLDMLLSVLVQRIKSTVLVSQMIMMRGKQEQEHFTPIKLNAVEQFFGSDFEKIISDRRLTQQEPVLKPPQMPNISTPSSSSSSSSLSKSGSNEEDEDSIPPPIQFAFNLRSELMLKTALDICANYCEYFSKNSWEAFLELIWWGRIHKGKTYNTLSYTTHTHTHTHIYIYIYT